MTRGQTPPARLHDHSAVGRAMAAGVYVAAALLGAGLAARALAGPGLLASRLLDAGLIVLMAAPLVRVLFALAEAVRSRDRQFTLATLVVLAILVATILSAILFTRT